MKGATRTSILTGNGGGEGGYPVIPSRASSKAAQSVRSILMSRVPNKDIDPLLLTVPESGTQLCERDHNSVWKSF